MRNKVYDYMFVVNNQDVLVNKIFVHISAGMYGAYGTVVTKLQYNKVQLIITILIYYVPEHSSNCSPHLIQNV